MTFSGWVATLAGWYVTEIGRQPWLVTGVLTTAHARLLVPAAMIGTTLAMYLAIYAVLIVAYVSVLFPPRGQGQIRHPAAQPRRRTGASGRRLRQGRVRPRCPPSSTPRSCRSCSPR